MHKFYFYFKISSEHNRATLLICADSVNAHLRQDI